MQKKIKMAPFYDPQKILLFVDSSEINHRERALDTLGQYLHDIYNRGLTTDPARDNSLKIPISFSILTRCDDISPEVRLQALKVLSLVAEILVKFLYETKDEKIFKIEDGVDISDLDLEVNGEHRFFWYCMGSFRERRRELMAILHRRLNDDSVPVRKSAIIAFGKLILADHTLATRKTLQDLKSAFKDPDSFVRKLSMESLTAILYANRNDSEVQKLWLQCILPLVDDPEDRVQSAAMILLEKQFLSRDFTSDEFEEKLSMALLEKLASDDFLFYHKFMKKAFSEWHLQNQLYSDCINRFRNCIETKQEKCLWFYLSLFAKYCPIPVEFQNLCVEHISVLIKTGECVTFIQYIMKTLLHMLQVWPTYTSANVQGISNDGLASFTVPVKLIPMYFVILVKINEMKGTLTELYEISAAVVENFQSELLNIMKEALSTGRLFPKEEVMAKYFRILAEIFLFRASYITPDGIRLLIFFSGCNKHPVVIPPSVKRQALLALGKICLQHKGLAHELLPVYLEEMISDDDILRNNACLILIDMCKCYPAVTDKCIPIICLCFKDKVYLVRYQAIIQIINLFQINYLKWKAPIFFGFLSVLADEKEAIRELGHYALSHLLPASERQMFLEYFTYSIFVFNYFSPPNDEKIADNVRKLIKFSIPGEKRRKDRLIMYSFFLEHMNPCETKQVIAFVCDVLTNVAESVFPLNKFTECLIRDCFAILNEIKIISLPFENINEELENKFSEAEMGLRRIFLVDPVLKVLGSLTSCVKNSNSALFRDIIFFLKGLLSDFIEDITEVLVQDKILLNQLQLEIRKDAEKKRMRIKRKRDLLIGRRNTEN